MQRGAIFILLLTLSSAFSTPLSFNFNIVEKHGLNLASFSEGPSLSVSLEDQGIQGEFCFGTKSQCFDMLIDLNSLTSWVADSSNSQKKINTFRKEDSTTCKVGHETELIYEDGRKVSGSFVQDILAIDRMNVGDFNFVSAKDSSAFSGINGMIAMGYSQSGNDNRYAFLSQLKSSGFIQHKVASIEFGKSSGKFTIGKLPKEAVSDYGNYGTCDLIPENNEESNKRAWYCNVNGIIIGKNKKTDTVYDFATKKAKFDLTISRTIVPIAYLLKLESEYFTKQIESGECNFGFKSVGSGYYAFTCESNNYDLSDITIMFDKWGINIPQDQLFTYDPVDKEYEFVLYGKDGYDGFAIGTNIMKNYLMVFDESNQNIGFYSQSNLIRFTNESLQPPKSYEDGSNPGKPPLINPEEGGKKPPLIDPDNNGNNKGSLIPDSGDKENEGGYRSPTLIDPGKAGTVIPQEEEGFWGKFFKTIGMLLLVLGLVFVGWLGFRYYRRKKYSDPTYYYKVTDEMFNEGTPLE